MRSFYSCCLLILLLCSCISGIPDPASYPYSQQKKMQASQHWEVLAKDLANRINNELIISDNIHRAVFVKETCGDEATPCHANETSSFNEAFRDLLITNLVEFGIPTNSRQDDEAIEVQYKVQVVLQNTERMRTIQPGLLTALSAAIVVFRNAPTDVIILATGVAADVAHYNLSRPGYYEVIITTSMITNEKYLFRASDIYYIKDKDFHHYQESRPQLKTIKLSSEHGDSETTR